MAREYGCGLASARLLSLVVVGLLGTNAVEGQITGFPSAEPSTVAMSQPTSVIDEVQSSSDTPTSVPTLQTCVPVGGKCETDFECCDHQGEMFCSVTCKARFPDSTKDETKLYKEDTPRGSLTRRALKGSSIRKGF